MIVSNLTKLLHLILLVTITAASLPPAPLIAHSTQQDNSRPTRVERPSSPPATLPALSNAYQPIPNALEPKTTTPATINLSATSTITITTAGFQPNVLTTTVGTEVTWHNTTTSTHILQSGEPNRVFLPIVLKSDNASSLTSENAPFNTPSTQPPIAASETFSATLPPGGVFTHTFSSTGTSPYFLATAPQFTGQVIVQEGSISPTVILSATPASGTVPLSLTLTATPNNFTSGQVFTYTWDFGDDVTQTVAVSQTGFVTATRFYPIVGVYTATVTVSDGQASASAGQIITVNQHQVNLPPDPADVAPPLDPTIATDLFAATEFLYAGNPPIQTGVAPGTIERGRVAVLRGKVTTRDGEPLSGVTITILDHPEFGQTLSRADGMFDMAVNGGGLLTVEYSKPGYLSAQRQVKSPWRDYTDLPDVVLIPLDSHVTAIDLTTSPDFQVARGSVISDTDGERQVTMLFPNDIQAEMVMSDGTTQTLTTLNVRAAEFTVGEGGPNAMPGDLPPNSAYTYAVELSIDEALGAGAQDVSFSQAVPIYNENFLGFPAGTNIPVGYYDPARGIWLPADNGLVISVVSITNGLADLDVDGSGAPASASALAALGITDAERTRLAQLYVASESLWRVPVRHFSKWDMNHGTRCLDNDCDPPNGDDPVANEGDEVTDPSCQGGSVIECENQVLGEQIDIAGTPFALHYRSNRVPGYSAPYVLDIPLSGVTVHPLARRIDLEVLVAGREFKQSFSPAPNLKTTFVWDGLDAYGRRVYGAQPARIKVGWVYEMEYVSTSQFGYNGNGIPITTDKARNEFTLWKYFTVPLQNLQTPRNNLGGWTLSVQHAYDPVARMLYLGDGSRHAAKAFGPIVDTVAGTGTSAFERAYFAVGPDGSLYMPEGTSGRVVIRLDLDGTQVIVAGNGRSCTPTTDLCGDGGPATQARLGNIQGLAVGLDGSLYLSDRAINRVRRIGPDGIITTVAGTGVEGNTGDGGPATQARLRSLGAVAIGRDGSLYLGQEGNDVRIRRVDPNGIISTFAGGGTSLANVITATAAAVDPRGLAIGPDGGLYLASMASGAPRVRRVRPDGMIETVAGSGQGGLGDGGPALQARFGLLRGIAFGPDGSLYISDRGNNRVRRLGQDGIVTTVGGNGLSCTTTQPCGDGGPAAQAALSPDGLAANPDGDLYVGTTGRDRVRRLRSALPDSMGSLEQFIASEDGSEIYTFAGRHLRTLDARTGAVRYIFSYNSVGNLVSVTDGDGNVTTIERNPGGLPTAIVGPDGHRTLLTLDANGFLASVTNPANETVLLGSNSDGLLTSMTTPRGHTYNYNYDNKGQLLRDDDPAGGSKTLTEIVAGNSYSVSVTTALSRTTLYAVQRLPTGSQQRETIDLAGLHEQLIKGNDDTWVTTYPDGSVHSLALGPDPRFLMQAPLARSGTYTTPGGLNYSFAEQRTVSLTNPINPLSLNTLTEAWTINGRVYASTYVSATHRMTDTTPMGRQVLSILDTQSRPLQVQLAGLLPLNLSYDARGRLTTISQGMRVVSVTYNSAGFPDTITDPLSRTTTFAYDAIGRVVSQSLPGGRTLGFAYDANGNLTALMPPGRLAHSFSYTPVDLVSTYVPPDVGAGSNQTQYVYNLDRQATQINRPDGQTISMAYDTAGRLQGLTMPGRTVTYGYDSSTGNPNTVGVLGGVSLTYTYDGPLMGTETWSGPVAGAISRTYDNNLRVTGLSVNGANAITFQYDNDNLLTQAGVLSLNHQPQNGLLSGTALGGMTTAYSYNGHGELISQTASMTNRGLHGVELARDNLGRISGKTETIGGVTTVYSYTYDTAGRLASEIVAGVTIASYTYDLNGNRLSVTRPNGTTSATYDNQDRLLQYGPTSYTYTPNGELLSQSAAGQTTNYGYDALGNLLSVGLPNGTQIAYVVDGRNRRVGRMVNGVLMQGWLYQDKLKPIAELDGSGNVVATFVYGTFDNVPDYMVKGGVTHRLLTDHLGSVRLVVNAATGQVVQRLDYDAFGRVLSDTNPGFQPFGFAGGMYDAATGLVRFGARDYDAETGRWTAKDPIGFAGGDTNLYGYIFNDPSNYTDPTGNGWREKLRAIGVAIGIILGGEDLPEGTGEGIGPGREDVLEGEENNEKYPPLIGPPPPPEPLDTPDPVPCDPELKAKLEIGIETGIQSRPGGDCRWPMEYTSPGTQRGV